MVLGDTAVFLQLTPRQEIQGSSYLTHNLWGDNATTSPSAISISRQRVFVYDPTCDKKWEIRMIMIIIISAPLVCAKHSFELPLKLSMPQIRVICSKTWFCSGVPFLNKWNHHIFFSSNQKLPVFRSSLTLAPRMLCKVKFCQFISAIHPVFFLLLPH